MDLNPEKLPIKPKKYKSDFSEALKNLAAFLQEKQYCDVTLIAANGDIKVDVHRLVLASSSEYFSRLFGGSLTEAEADEVKFDNVDGETLETIINFIYTNSIKLETDSVENIFKAAHYFQIKDLQEICSEYIKTQLEPSNCLGITLFAEQYDCKDLYEASYALALRNFTKLRENTEFYLLDVDQLSKFLSSNELRASSEEEIFDCLMSWIDHDRDNRGELIAELLKHIRLPLLQPRFIADVVEEVCSSNECKELIYSAYKWLALRTYQPGIISDEQIQLRSFEDVLIAISGWNNKDSVLKVGFYYCGYDDWIYREWPGPPCRLSGVCCTAIDGKLIVAGKQKVDLDCLDLRTLQWTQLPPIKHVMKNCHMCTLNGKIYLMGKIHDENNGRILTWDPSKAQWEVVSELQGMYPICTCVRQGLLISYFSNKTLQSYDPLTRSWEAEPNEDSSIVGIASVSIHNVDHFITVYPTKIKILNTKDNTCTESEVNLDFATGCMVFKNQLIVYGKGVFKKLVNCSIWESMPTLKNQQGEVILLSCQNLN